jgi:hypothetical protein
MSHFIRIETTNTVLEDIDKKKVLKTHSNFQQLHIRDLN